MRYKVPRADTQRKAKRVIAMVEQGTPTMHAIRAVDIPHTTYKNAKLWLKQESKKASEGSNDDA